MDPLTHRRGNNVYKPVEHDHQVPELIAADGGDLELAEFGRCDARVVGGIDAGYASTNDAAPEEAHDADDLALFGEALAYVLVEVVNDVRRLFRGERDSMDFRLSHYGTTAGER